MPLAEDLLAQSYVLNGLDQRRPKQASLRRAVSTAYYALFHLLVADCIQRVSPSSPAALPNRVARALSHTEMREVCESICKSRIPGAYAALIPGSFSGDLRAVAETFIDLQQERHQADYNLEAVYSRSDVLELLNSTKRTFARWKAIRATDEATVFLAALLFAKRWSR